MRDALETARSRDNLQHIIKAAGGQSRLAHLLSSICNKKITKQTIGNWLHRSGVSKEGAVLILAYPNLAPLYRYDDFFAGITPEDVARIAREYGIKHES